MKPRIFGLASLLFLTLTAPTLADQGTSRITQEDFARLYAGDEMLGVKPALGFLTYNNQDGSPLTRICFGVNAEYNLASRLNLDTTRWFVGGQTGLIFSHLGSPNANFFGEFSRGDGAGANLMVLPLNLKAAVSTASWFRGGVHAGSNFIHRSIAESVQLDETDLHLRWVPNLGMDFDFSISKTVSVSVRPDWTLSSVHSLFTATAALGIVLN